MAQKLSNIILINGRYLTRKPTGVERVAYKYTQCLMEYLSPNDLKIIMPKNKQINSFYKIPQKYLIRIGRMVGPSTLAGHFWEQTYLPLYIKKHYPNSLLLNFANTAPLLHKKNVILLHDVAFIDVPENFPLIFRIYYKFLLNLILPKASKIFTVSNFSKKQILKYFKLKPKDITVIHNGIRVFIDPAKLKTYKKSNGSSTKYITYLGSISYRKNAHNIIKAFLIAKNKYPKSFKNIKLLLIGKKDKTLAASIPEDAFNNPDIIFAGYVPDEKLKEYLVKTLFAVIVPIYEGFNLMPGEFILSGIPVLLSDIPVNNEIYKNYPYKANSLDPNDIAKGMKHMLENLKQAQHFVQEYRNFIKENYSWKRACETLKTLTIKSLEI